VNDNVIDLSAMRPHLAGPMVCLGCKHEWVGVAPVGTRVFDCPECGCAQGVMQGLVEPEEHFQCDCGNYHYIISATKIMCSMCGKEPVL